jgi:predicted DNA-binding protein
MSMEELVAELKEIRAQASKIRSKTLRNFFDVYRVSELKVLFDSGSTHKGKMKAKMLAEEMGVSIRTAEDYLKAVKIFKRLRNWCDKYMNRCINLIVKELSKAPSRRQT